MRLTYSKNLCSIWTFIQILTRLNLIYTSIDDKKLQRLNHVLYKNTIKQVFFSSSITYQLLSISTDTYHTETLSELHRWWRCATFGSCITQFIINDAQYICFRWEVLSHFLSTLILLYYKLVLKLLYILLMVLHKRNI
jgi:hypothetical protein